MDETLLVVLGGIGGVCGYVFFVLFLGILFRSRRKNPVIHGLPIYGKTRESANWLNVLLARLNSIRVDQVLLRTMCDFVSQMIANDPNRPEFLTDAKVSSLKPAHKSFFFSEFIITQAGDTSSLSISFAFQGAPSISVSASASSGPADLPKLFTVSVNVEFILEFLVGRITLACNENNELWVTIGNDLIVDVHVRPLLDLQQNAQTRHVESISEWVNNTILKSLRGKRIMILGPAVDSKLKEL